MKTNTLGSIKLAIVASLAIVQVAKADFDITFGIGNNFLSNPVFDVGGSVVNTASYLSGTAYKGQLYVGADAGSLTKLGTGGLVITASGNVDGIRTFLTSGGAGFINGGAFTVTSGTFNAGSSAVYQVRVWEAAYSSFEAAALVNNAKIGSSAVTAITLGGTTTGATPVLITAKADLHGAFGLTTVPEPATLALGIFGAAGMLFRRRK